MFHGPIASQPLWAQLTWGFIFLGVIVAFVMLISTPIPDKVYGKRDISGQPVSLPGIICGLFCLGSWVAVVILAFLIVRPGKQTPTTTAR